MSEFLAKARAVAYGWHAGQKYGEMPFTFHLNYVEWVLRRHGVTDENLLAAGILHDILEDTPLMYWELRELVGEDVARLVELVTDEPGANRKERKAKTLAKTATDMRAVLVKFADRIANIEATFAEALNGSDRAHKLLKMYWEEFDAFLVTLDPTEELEGLDRLWNTLLDLDIKLDEYADDNEWKK